MFKNKHYDSNPISNLTEKKSSNINNLLLEDNRGIIQISKDTGGLASIMARSHAPITMSIPQSTNKNFQ